ncbi:hypothetical protein BpHYR1_050144 [Brachionus plicatilis]|uniref:Uncharacterized protein n=1 Tax=Brachionus plicatilis TaxID=10195 RepID=A0A3M7Q830_BRAPC|nr:hypothetical protein BpHYR1_050144 [Brachionus plicatilis]
MKNQISFNTDLFLTNISEKNHQILPMSFRDRDLSDKYFRQVLAAFIAPYSISFIIVLGLRSGLISKIFFCLFGDQNRSLVVRQPEDSFSLQIQDLYPIIFDSYLNRYFSTLSEVTLSDRSASLSLIKLNIDNILGTMNVV